MAKLELWDSTLKAAMKLPVVNVDRKTFLAKELKPFCSEEVICEVINNQKRITEVLSKEQINKLVLGVIKYHLTIVTGTSALAGLPGGWALAGTIPADLAQFFGHVLALTQKLIYLYGGKELTDDGGNLTDEAAQILTIFVGVMFGSQAAIQGLKETLEMLSKGITQVLAKNAVTKTAVYQLSKQIAKYLGVKLSKDTFIKGVGKLIPLVGAPISGAVTYWTFRPMAMRLKRYLDDNYQALAN